MEKQEQEKGETVSAVEGVVNWLVYFAKRTRQKLCEHRFRYYTRPKNQYGVRTLTSCTCEKCGRSFQLNVIVPHEYLEEGEQWSANTVNDYLRQDKAN